MEDSKQIERPYDLDDRSQCGEREPIDHTSPARKRVDRRKRGRGRMGENGRLAVAAAAGAGAAANREGRGGAEPKPKAKAKARSWLLSASPRISRLSWFSSLFFFPFLFGGGQVAFIYRTGLGDTGNESSPTICSSGIPNLSISSIRFCVPNSICKL